MEDTGLVLHNRVAVEVFTRVVGIALQGQEGHEEEEE